MIDPEFAAEASEWLDGVRALHIKYQREIAATKDK